MPPTGEDMERFIPAILPYLRTPFADTVPSYEYIKLAIYSLTSALIFVYVHFRLSKHEIVRIAAMRDKLLNEGKLTKQRKRERHWVSAQLIAHLTTTAYEKAIEKGTNNWDVKLPKIMSMVYLGALTCRGGDITRSNRYTGQEYLQWNSVILKYKREQSGQSIRSTRLGGTIESIW
jgi:hypothetical protein